VSSVKKRRNAMILETNKEYLHKDGTIHKVYNVIGSAAHVQIWKDDVLTGGYSTDISDNKMWDTELEALLQPLTEK